MQNIQSNVFWGRDDTAFGVCAAIGEDFGFNPLFLRFAFAGFLFFNPMAAIASYLALGVVVLVSRLVAPNPRMASEPAAALPADRSEPTPADNQMELALAA
jgi:phage shock protein C